jgi:hypothetical protein
MSPAVCERTHPQWLCEKLVLGTLPWHRAQLLSYGEFSERYTLYDSRWIGLFQDGVGQPFAGLTWSRAGLPEAMAAQLPPGDPPYLFIKFIETLGVTFTKASAHPSGIIAKTEMVEIEGHDVFLIEDNNGNAITVVLQGELLFLAIDRQNRVIQL